MHGNQQAWDCLYGRYQNLVLSWVTRHSLYAGLGEEASYFMNRAFEKMWQGIPAENFDKFTDLKSLLRYLQMCTHAVMVDFARWKEQAHLWDRANQSDNGDEAFDPFMLLADDDLPPEREIAQREMQALLWEKLLAFCNSDKEEKAIYGYFVLDLKPREIFDYYSDEFIDVQDVSRTKDNFLARLRRSDEFREFLDDA